MCRLLIIFATVVSLTSPLLANELPHGPVRLAQSELSSQEKCFELIGACVANCSVLSQDQANDACLENCPSLGLCGSSGSEKGSMPGSQMPAGKMPSGKLPGSRMPGSRLPAGDLN